MLSNIKGYADQLKSTNDDDSIDRLNYVTTIFILIGLAVTLFTQSYVGEPLQCWTPAQWTDTWEGFSEAYCFVENTYFVPMNNSNLPAHHTREGREMIYYQWVPFILLIMGLMFYVPRAVWKIFSTYSGLTLSDMIQTARKTAKSKAEDKSVAFNIAAVLSREYDGAKASVRYGSYLFNLYLGVKVLILINVVAQLLTLNIWLGTEYRFWGLGILWDMLHGRHWQQSGNFPRVTYCDVVVREMGNVNNWTLQCVLMVNMFNEKVFIFLWFWFAILSVLTLINLISWLVRRTPGNAIRFLEELVSVHEKTPPGQGEIAEFYEEVLQADGLMLLRMIDDNAGSMISSEVAHALWKTHRDSEGSDTTLEDAPPRT